LIWSLIMAVVSETVTTQTTPKQDIPMWYTRISWGAIFAGLVMALAVQLLLSLLGLGIGMSTVDPATEANATAGLGMGAAIWFAISAIISMFLGGLVGGRLANGTRNDGLLHGLLVWGLTTLMTFYLLTTAVGRVVSGVGSLVGAGLSAGGSAVAAVAPELKDSAAEMLQKNGFDLSNIKQQAETLLRQTGKTELQPEVLQAKANDAADQTAETAQDNANTSTMQQNDNLDELLGNLFREGQDTVQAVDREAVVNVLVARGKTQAEAEQTVDGWIGAYQTASQKLKDAEVKARQVADDAANAASKGALWAFLALLLGAIAAAVGGRVASKTSHEKIVTTTIRH
jgi:hypothetical protein